MRKEESRWIGDFLESVDVSKISPLLNLGSSSAAFRKITQPHIYDNIFRNLEKRGCVVLHQDLKDVEGVDIVGNIMDGNIQKNLVDSGIRSIICTNLLEHVTEPEKIISICLEVIPVGGILVISVPYSYPYHPDPIDTLYRPSVQELKGFLLQRGCEVLASSNIRSSSLWMDMRESPQVGLKLLVRILCPFVGLRPWIGALHRLRWLFKCYEVSCVVCQKTQRTFSAPLEKGNTNGSKSYSLHKGGAVK